MFRKRKVDTWVSILFARIGKRFCSFVSLATTDAYGLSIIEEEPSASAEEDKTFFLSLLNRVYVAFTFIRCVVVKE